MANWQRTLVLADVWRCGDHHKIAATVAERLSKLAPFNDPHIDEQRDDITDEFKSIAEDVTAGLEDFNGVLGRLYNWADQRLDSHWNGKKVCWVQTA